ncbi:hypothetical protein D5086_011281 [Populus alba]|uniref:Uncharacterized protein n=1 Tax=Populus alba TaxID=43335 RepID=A0ACC4CCX7_POPAL
MQFRGFEFGKGELNSVTNFASKIEQRLVELVCVIPAPLTFRHARLHDRSPSSDSLAPPYAAPSLGNDCVGYSGPVGGSRWPGGGSRLDYGAVVLVVEEVEDVVVGIIKVVGGTARGSSM